MAGNHVLLETISLTQTASSVTFNNLPSSGYTDLKLVVSGRSDRTSFAWTNIKVQFNGSTSGYTYKQLAGAGSAGYSSVNQSNDGEGATGIVVYALSQGNSTSNAFGNSEIYIHNYNSTSIYKSLSSDGVMENNVTDAGMGMTSGLWSNNSAITSIVLTPQISGTTYNFVAGSTFSLYGVADVNTTPTVAPKATGGNIVANDGTYWYHAFLTSGYFVPQTSLTCDYLVVAGGGGAGVGGGGAGGLRSTVGTTGGGGSLESPISVTAIPYAITVGAGGTAGISGTTVAANGGNSTFSTITATGGGAGALTASVLYNGTTGGSGGGSGFYSVNPYPQGTAGSGTANQGYTGSVGYTSGSNTLAGGGGGAGAAGSTTSSNYVGRAGGAGVAISAFAAPTNTGVSNYYAGGGGGQGDTGGGAGGAGGGGAGVGGTATGNSGVAATGGGAGGGYTSGGSGGSGIVIIRYAMV